MSVVSNTGPLIALAKTDRLALLRQLFGEVLIPVVVQRELLGKSGTEAGRLDTALSDFVHVADLDHYAPEIMVATLGLDAGERDAVALAYQKGLPLVIDDRAGRRSAQRLGMKITGIAGIMIQARKRGLIASVPQELEAIRHHGYWLSDELIEIATTLAGEELP